MPISKENKKRYPPDWQQIRQRIVHRSAGFCERCGIRNYSVATQMGTSYKVYGTYATYREARGAVERWREHEPGCTPIVIVLAVAHLQHDPTRNDPQGLLALCQRCHLAHDLLLHRTNARATRMKKHWARMWDDKNCVV